MKKIKVSKILEGSHSLMNEVVTGTASHLADADLVVKLDDLLKERGLTQKDLALMTGMRVGTISEFSNGRGISINKVQLLSIMVALRITDISDLFGFNFPTELEKTYREESIEWKATKEMPISVKEMYRENVIKQTVDK